MANTSAGRTVIYDLPSGFDFQAMVTGIGSSTTYANCVSVIYWDYFGRVVGWQYQQGDIHTHDITPLTVPRGAVKMGIWVNPYEDNFCSYDTGVVTELFWAGNSGDKLYLARKASAGNQELLVFSDGNPNVERTKSVLITSDAGISRELTVVQKDLTDIPIFYDYLYFDGTAYIDTDIIPANLSSYQVSLGMETLKAAQRVFMLRAGTSDYIGVNLSSRTTSTNRTIATYYGVASTSGSKTLAFSNQTYSFFLTPKRFGWGNSAYTYTKGSSTPAGPLILGSMPGHSGQAYTGRMGIFRAYGSDAQNVTTNAEFCEYLPTITLRPCTYNGEAGMWHVEGNKFFGNTAGAGQLSVGNAA